LRGGTATKGRASRGPFRFGHALSAFDIRIVLRRLAPVEHAVVAHDPHAAKPRAIRQRKLALKRIGRRIITPLRELDDIARRQYGV
jgi:hypothetical protein